jgi:hypothetical protein
MAERVPSVHRDDTLGGLQYECAIEWCKFIYEQAHWDGDLETYDRYRVLYEHLKASPKGSLFSKDLEARVAHYTKAQAPFDALELIEGGPQCLKCN